jgi:hypothetical protein
MGQAGFSATKSSAKSATNKSATPSDTRSAAPKVTSRQLLSRVVGSAGENTITSREVQINAAVEQILYFRSQKPGEVKLLDPNSKEFSNEVVNVLLEWIVYLEAKSFSHSTVTRAEEQKAIGIVQETAARLPFWRSLEVSGDELETMIERKLTAKKFLSFKNDSSLVPVTDAEALSYFKKNRLKFGNMPFDAFRENIKIYLIKQQVDRRLKDWFEVLQRKYRVRNFVSESASSS